MPLVTFVHVLIRLNDQTDLSKVRLFHTPIHKAIGSPQPTEPYSSSLAWHWEPEPSPAHLCTPHSSLFLCPPFSTIPHYPKSILRLNPHSRSILLTFCFMASLTLPSLLSMPFPCYVFVEILLVLLKGS